MGDSSNAAVLDISAMLSDFIKRFGITTIRERHYGLLVGTWLCQQPRKMHSTHCVTYVNYEVTNFRPFISKLLGQIKPQYHLDATLHTHV